MNILNKIAKYDRIITNILSLLSIIMASILLVRMSDTWSMNVSIKNRYKQLESESEQYLMLLNEMRSMYETDAINDYEFNSDIALKLFAYSLNDKYASYFSPNEAKISSLNYQGEGHGIGVKVAYYEDFGLKIVKIFNNSSADKAGLKIGDYIVSVDGVDYADVGYEAMIERLRGNIGDIKKITVYRDGTLIDIDVKIEIYELETVSYKFQEDIPVISIDSFVKNTDEAFIKTINELVGLGCNKFIIDLRNNTGGYAETSANMVDRIVGKGLIVELRNKNNEILEKYESDSKEVDGKFVILTNGMTASASEMFIQALKDYDKAVTVGTKTYGKGSTLITRELANGGQFTYTNGIYRTKSGRELEGNGIEPDFKVEIPDEVNKSISGLTYDEDTQLQKAIEVIKSYEKQ